MPPFGSMLPPYFTMPPFMLPLRLPKPPAPMAAEGALGGLALLGGLAGGLVERREAGAEARLGRGARAKRPKIWGENALL
jgi:hypothetical protein